VSEPFLALGVLEDLSLGGTGHELVNWVGVLLGADSVGFGDDRGVDLLVKVFAGLSVSSGEALGPLRELSFELSWVFNLKFVHVLGNVATKDSGFVDVGIILGLRPLSIGSFTSLVGNNFDLGLGVTWESLGVMWNVKTTIASTFKSTENSGSGSGSLDTNIEESFEWSLVFNVLKRVEVFTVNLGVSLVHLIKSNLFKESSGQQKTGAVSSRVVGKTSSKTELLKLR